MTSHSSLTLLDQISRTMSLLPSKGRAGALQMSRVMDSYFISRLEETGFTGLKSSALAAVGGYGRNELSLRSDIDVLIVSDEPDETTIQEMANAMFHPLWDLHLEVGHGVRSTLECLHLAQNDFTVLTSLLDMRFICGDAIYFRELQERFQGGLDSRKHELLKYLVHWGLKRAGDINAKNYIEPDIKDDSGGLRDYHLIHWLEKLVNPAQTYQYSLLKQNNWSSLFKTMDFFFELRNVLHFLSRRKNDRLYLDFQPETSKIMGYADTAERSSVELFLGDLFYRQNIVSEMAGQAIEKTAGAEGIRFMSAVPLTNCSGQDLTGKAEVEQGSASAEIKSNPLLVADLLGAMAASAEHLPWNVIAEIKEHLKDPDYAEELRTALAKNFSDMLMGDHIVMCIRAMHRADIFKLVLPELDRLWYFVQFDGVHTYPLGEHSLECLRLVVSFDEENGFLAQYIGSYRNNPGLRLAALLHDTGKGKAGHAEAGSAIARTIADRLGIDRVISDEIVFLIKNHLLMHETAMKHDIDEETVVAGFAGKLVEMEKLNLLTFLSYADSRATGPRVWNDWNENLIRMLYFKSRRIMQHTILAGHHAGHRMAAVRDKVRSHRLYDESWEALVQSMPPRYLLKIPVPDIIRHVPLVQKFAQSAGYAAQKPLNSDFILLTEKNRDSHEHWNLTLVTRDRPGLLAAVAASLAMNNVEIYSAGLFTWENGVVVDLFKVSSPVDPLYARNTWMDVRDDLHSFMAGKRDIQQFCNSMKKKSWSGAGVKAVLDNNSSDFYTIIEINCHRHPCLTWVVSKCLAELGMDIAYAVITTHMEQVMFAAHARDGTGQKIEDSQGIIAGEIQKALKVLVA